MLAPGQGAFIRQRPAGTPSLKDSEQGSDKHQLWLSTATVALNTDTPSRGKRPTALQGTLVQGTPNSGP